jgi:hypothetical protein
MDTHPTAASVRQVPITLELEHQAEVSSTSIVDYPKCKEIALFDLLLNTPSVHNKTHHP